MAVIPGLKSCCYVVVYLVRSIELENGIMYSLYIIEKKKFSLDTGSSIHFLGVHLSGDVCDVADQDPNRDSRSCVSA